MDFIPLENIDPNLHYVYYHIDPDTGDIMCVFRGQGYRCMGFNMRSHDHSEWLKDNSHRMREVVRVVAGFTDPEDSRTRKEQELRAYRRVMGRLPPFNMRGGAGGPNAGHDRRPSRAVPDSDVEVMDRLRTRGESYNAIGEIMDRQPTLVYTKLNGYWEERV